eukprot:GHUV01050421.1.p1 GENE.GHUV01050421.1~~GHUV01050421.1.p1  ORF type:complete len:122 (+),score=26.05 GHUV01050421.1:212-577(+)
MAFFKRLMDHMLNQVLVETLANSRWFQRFAVYTDKLTKEAAERSKQVVAMRITSCRRQDACGQPMSNACLSAGKDHSKVLDEQVSSVLEKSKAFTSKLREDFAQELKKLQEADAQQRRMKK